MSPVEPRVIFRVIVLHFLIEELYKFLLLNSYSNDLLLPSYFLIIPNNSNTYYAYICKSLNQLQFWSSECDIFMSECTEYIIKYVFLHTALHIYIYTPRKYVYIYIYIHIYGVCIFQPYKAAWFVCSPVTLHFVKGTNCITKLLWNMN